MRPHRHPNSTDGAGGARPKRMSKYGLLAPAEPAGNHAAAELQERGDVHKATLSRGDLDTRETKTGDRNGQRALQACSQPEDADEEWRPSEEQRALNSCGHQGVEGGGGGGSPNSARLPRAARG